MGQHNQGLWERRPCPWSGLSPGGCPATESQRRNPCALAESQPQTKGRSVKPKSFCKNQNRPGKTCKVEQSSCQCGGLFWSCSVWAKQLWVDLKWEEQRPTSHRCLLLLADHIQGHSLVAWAAAVFLGLNDSWMLTFLLLDKGRWEVTSGEKVLWFPTSQLP